MSKADGKYLKGYTLIEILAVLGIIGILFTSGYVSYRDFSRRQALSSAVALIQGDLRLAQSMAAAGNKPANVKCTGTNLLNGYNFNVTSSTTYNLEAKCTGGVVVTKSVTVPAGVSISTFPSPNPILFKSLGSGTNIASNATASIVISQLVVGTTQTITVAASGKIQ